MTDARQVDILCQDMSIEPGAEITRLPFRSGEPALIIDSQGREHVVHLRAGGTSHHGRTGLVHHDEIIGRPPGLRVYPDKGQPYLCLRPNLSEYILKRLRRRTQIIYPKDLGTLLIEGNIYPGARVLEAGIGSASAAITLLRFLSPGGELISYETREEFAGHSQQTIEEFREWYGTVSSQHSIRIQDAYQGIEESDLDAVLLDVPEPEKAAPFALESLRTNGTMLCWLPTALQVYNLVRHLKNEPRWAQVKTTESLMRPWFVGPVSVRPSLTMVGHTGFLTTARRVELINPPAESCHQPDPDPGISGNGESG